MKQGVKKNYTEYLKQNVGNFVSKFFLVIYFIYAVAKFLFEPSCQDEARGTTIQYIVKGDLEHFTFTYEESVAVFCNKVIKVLLSHTLLIHNEIECMGKLKSLLLSKLA